MVIGCLSSVLKPLATSGWLHGTIVIKHDAEDDRRRRGRK
jgi:hypothetical protein